MCRLSEAELYCVSTNVRRMSELMQLESAISTRRYLPPSGTAGFERCCVSGKRRLPAPPPRITASSFAFWGTLVGGSTCERGILARSFLCDLYADTRADSRRAGFDHPARVFETLHAARRFHTELRSDCASHERNVGNSRAAF